jgi:hypothetical protein
LTSNPAIKFPKFKTEISSCGLQLNLPEYQINTLCPSVHQNRAAAIPGTSAGDICLVSAFHLFISVTSSLSTFVLVLELELDPGLSVLFNSETQEITRKPIYITL